MRVVADASALLEYLFGTARAPSVEAIIAAADAEIHVPALCDVEIAAGVRRALLTRALPMSRATAVVEDYLDLSLTRHGHTGLIDRILELRENFSAYDATCVALCESLDAALLTADKRLASATGDHTSLEVLQAW